MGYYAPEHNRVLGMTAWDSITFRLVNAEIRPWLTGSRLHKRVLKRFVDVAREKQQDAEPSAQPVVHAPDKNGGKQQIKFGVAEKCDTLEEHVQHRRSNGLDRNDDFNAPLENWIHTLFLSILTVNDRYIAYRFA